MGVLQDIPNGGVFVGKGQRGDQLYPQLTVISSGNITRYYCMWRK